MVAASKGYGCVVSMPRVCTNVERHALIKAYGGVVLLSEPNEGAEGMLRLAKAADALGNGPTTRLGLEPSNAATLGRTGLSSAPMWWSTRRCCIRRRQGGTVYESFTVPGGAE